MSASAPDSPTTVPGIRLSALASYTGLPGSIPGVGFWPRVCARLIDIVVHIVVSFFAGIFFTILLAIAAGGHIPPLILLKLKHTTLLSFVLALLGSVVYHTLCEGIHGSSLGKRLLSMVVVQEDGSPCRLGSAFIRSLAYLIDSLFFGAIAYFTMQRTPQEQRYGDEWAHTVVCKRSDAPAGTLRDGGRFAVAFIFAVLADASLALIGLLAKIM
jgi:uncharacterized RDD family membrane protein YckC